jgi:hypothetical protein
VSTQVSPQRPLIAGTLAKHQKLGGWNTILTGRIYSNERTLFRKMAAERQERRKTGKDKKASVITQNKAPVSWSFPKTLFVKQFLYCAGQLGSRSPSWLARN